MVHHFSAPNYLFGKFYSVGKVPNIPIVGCMSCVTKGVGKANKLYRTYAKRILSRLSRVLSLSKGAANAVSKGVFCGSCTPRYASTRLLGMPSA
jgi:hypothetical protein